MNNFVVLVAQGLSAYKYIQCDSQADAKAAIDETLCTTLSQSFVIAVSAR